jgi:hypothetical protein
LREVVDRDLSLPKWPSFMSQEYLNIDPKLSKFTFSGYLPGKKKSDGKTISFPC